MPYVITVLPATQQWWLSRLYPSQCLYTIYRPQMDSRLDWSLWRLYPKIVYPPQKWRAVSWLGIEPATASHQYDVLAIRPLSHPLFSMYYEWETVDCCLLLQGSLLDLNELAVHTAELIVNRGYLERRHNTSEDDGLLGLLTLATVICKHNPPFKSSPGGQVISCPVFSTLLFFLL